MIEAIQLTQLTPTAAEYLNSAALARAIAGEDRDNTAAHQCALALRAEGLPQAVERHIADLSELAARHGAANTTRLDREADAALWARIADLPQVAELGSDEALLKLTALPFEVERVIAQIELLAARADVHAIINARALNGILYVRLQPVAAETLNALLAELPGMQWVATALPGVRRWGAPPPGLDLMRRIKAEFDPAGMLNWGRYVEGI